MAKKRSAPAQGGLSIRVDVTEQLRLGPGKVALLEAIGELGSISAAGRSIGMSYKRAWDLVEELNRGCEQPVVSTSPGGRDGGGSRLTPTGAALIRLYREIEHASIEATQAQLGALHGIATPVSA